MTERGVSSGGWDIRLRYTGRESAIFWRRLDEGLESNLHPGPHFVTHESGDEYMDTIRRLIERGATYEKILNLVRVEDRLTHYGDFT